MASLERTFKYGWKPAFLYTLEADPIPVLVEAKMTLVEDKAGDAEVGLDENRLLFDHKRALGGELFKRAPHGLEERLVEVVHIVGDRLILLGVVEQWVVAECRLRHVASQRVPPLTEGEILRGAPREAHTTVVTGMDFPEKK